MATLGGLGEGWGSHNKTGSPAEGPAEAAYLTPEPIQPAIADNRISFPQ